MQTFLPYADFKKSAECLDYKRLGKQRVEAWQIYRALTDENYGWKNHPIVKMWRGYEYMLLQYGFMICVEWRQRGYKDNMMMRFNDELAKFTNAGEQDMPSWLGDEKIHASHRSNLLRKDPDHYGKFGWTESDNLPYIWRV